MSVSVAGLFVAFCSYSAHVTPSRVSTESATISIHLSRLPREMVLPLSVTVGTSEEALPLDFVIDPLCHEDIVLGLDRDSI